MFERSKKGEHALLIQPMRSGTGGSSPDDGAQEEFADLARSAGATIAAVITARVDKPSPSTYIGSGKLDEVKAAAEATGADLILVNHALSPGQERNLEKFLERRVLDRTGLILDIFAQRARSFEGKLQVELAQLQHMATRLIRGWTHLERQRGGSIGLRGPGETQLETDRRLLQKRVDQLQKRLEKVEVQQNQMRRARVRSEMPRVALVGYTNAGKSTLFNAVTGSDAYAADKLFATLDPTVRRVNLRGGSIMLSDTVGFVRDLPHELVAAFRSTLSEAREADLLLHLIDAADPLREDRIAQVDAVLQEIGAGDIPQLLVYNKIDRIPARGEPADGEVQDESSMKPRRDQPNQGRERVWLSARDNLGMDLLEDALTERLSLVRVQGALHLPAEHAERLRSRLHQLGAVRSETHDEQGWHIDVDLSLADAQRLAVQAGGAPLEVLLPEALREEWMA